MNSKFVYGVDMPSAGLLGRRERNKAEKRRRIAEAAATLFAENGYARTTMQQVAAAADVADGTIFRYAGTKPELLLMVLNEQVADLLEHGRIAAASAPTVADAVVALIHLARAALSGELPLTAPADIDAGLRQLQTLPGIGRWTANYFALRGWQAKDIFLPDDYLIKQRFPGMTPAAIARYARRWQPMRSYALLHIWYTDDWAPAAE
mgnify:CR=1 FL=1